MSQIDTENDKNFQFMQKIFFQRLMHFSSRFDRLRGLEYFKDSTRKKLIVQ